MRWRLQPCLTVWRAARARLARLLRLAESTRAPNRLSRKQLLVRSDTVKDHRVAPNSIYHQKVRAEVALRQPSPIGTALVESMLPERLRQSATRDHQVKDMLQRFGLEFRVLSCVAIVALEARQDDQLPSQRRASRPLRKVFPFPAASSLRESLSAVRNSVAERFGFARETHAFSAADASFSPVRALSILISRSVSRTVTLVISASRVARGL